MADPWDVVKDGLGFAGTALMTYPWARDYAQRVKRDWLRGLPIAGDDLNTAVERLAKNIDHGLDRAKRRDLACMAFGMLFVAASFFISLWRGLFIAGG